MLVYQRVAIEHGPVKIAALPSKMVDLSIGHGRGASFVHLPGASGDRERFRKTIDFIHGK